MAGSLYDRYVEKFNKAVKNSKYFGDKNMYMRHGFENVFASAKEDFIKMYGYEPSKNDVIRHIIDEQQYETSRKYGNNVRKAMRARGLDVSLEDIRSSIIHDESGRLTYNENADPKVKEFFNAVDSKYHELINSGKSSKEAAIIIARMFFGSP